MSKFGKHLDILKKSGLESPQKKTVDENLEFPLPHYWIASSHNTYLLEDQLKGPASVCGYLLFLNTFGGGCVEIDPGKLEIRPVIGGQPIQDVTVTHLGTQTGRIFLSDLLRDIRQWLTLNKATGPVILSFDNKKLKSKPEQEAIWRLLDMYINMSTKNTLCHTDPNGCKWYLKPNDVNGENFASLTPKSLTGKIVIKWAECRSIDTKGKCNDEKAKKGLIVRDSLPSERYIHMPKSKECKLHEQDCTNQLSSSVWEVRSTHQEYSYYKPINKGVVKNTQRHFVRVFPNPLQASKVKSGNYPPAGSWLNGAQLVAINTQKQDRYWHVHHAMFENSPYRLKPQWMRSASIVVPTLKNLLLKFSDDSLTGFHPSGETKNGKKVKNQEILFEKVYKDACIVYFESLDGFKGAVEIPSSLTSGTVLLKLYKYNRPLKSGVKYMGPDCNYSVGSEKSVKIQFIWSE